MEPDPLVPRHRGRSICKFYARSQMPCQGPRKQPNCAMTNSLQFPNRQAIVAALGNACPVTWQNDAGRAVTFILPTHIHCSPPRSPGPARTEITTLYLHPIEVSAIGRAGLLGRRLRSALGTIASVPDLQVWAEPFTKLRLQKIFNLFQDPYERADFTSNTFWDWQLNHVGSVYGVMDEVFKFAATFQEYPPRSIPPSFNPANVMEETIHDIREQRTRAMEAPQ